MFADFNEPKSFFDNYFVYGSLIDNPLFISLRSLSVVCLYHDIENIIKYAVYLITNK